MLMYIFWASIKFLGNVVDKRSLGRLLPIHFACDLNAFNSVAGYGFGYQFMQFQSFVAVVVWLCTTKLGAQAEKEALKIDVDQDSPAMVAKQILRILQVLSIFCTCIHTIVFE